MLAVLDQPHMGSYRDALDIMQEYVAYCRRLGLPERFCRVTGRVIHLMVYWLDEQEQLDRFPDELTMDDIEEYLVAHPLVPSDHQWAARLGKTRRDTLEAFLWWAADRRGREPS